MAVSLGASALVHLLLFAFFSFGAPGGPRDVRLGRTAPRPAAPPAMRAIEMRVVEGEVTPEPEEDAALPALPRATEPPALPAEPPRAQTPAGPPARAEDALERLRPRPRDPRLWSGVREAPLPAESPEEEARRRLLASIQALNDSILAHDEAARRATDWTVTDGAGRRWGLSPEGIHLGGMTLYVAPFRAPVGRREEIERRIREWAEIQAQVDRAATREDFNDRVREIRERKESERGDG